MVARNISKKLWRIQPKEDFHETMRGILSLARKKKRKLLLNPMQIIPFLLKPPALNPMQIPFFMKLSNDKLCLLYQFKFYKHISRLEFKLKC